QAEGQHELPEAAVQRSVLVEDRPAVDDQQGRAEQAEGGGGDADPAFDGVPALREEKDPGQRSREMQRPADQIGYESGEDQPDMDADGDRGTDEQNPARPRAGIL